MKKVKDLGFFLSNTTLEDGCLIWKGCFNTDGYARTAWSGHSNGKVHRIVYELYYKDNPDGFVVRHSCDNPKCINPIHLSRGTNTENIKDRTERNRHGQRKIESKDVGTIRLLYKTKQYTQKEIGNLFGINSRTVSSIIKGSHWKSVPLPKEV